MPEMEQRLKSPSIETLQRLIKRLDQMIDDGAPIEFTEPEGVDVYDTLKWVLTFLDNRRLYHKKRLMQGKFERQLLEDALRGKGIDVSALKRKAANLEADALIDASDEEPELPPGA